MDFLPSLGLEPRCVLTIEHTDICSMVGLFVYIDQSMHSWFKLLVFDGTWNF